MILDRVQGRVERNYPLHRLTTWKIGGPAEYVYWPAHTEELEEVLRSTRAEGIPLWVIGRGSNLLIADEGLPGIAVVTTSLDGIEWRECRVRAQAGYSLARLAQESGDRGVSGLEFARGIPGTLGGAVIMNAGAHGADISGLILAVTVLRPDGTVVTVPRADLEFGYRHSSLRSQGVVLEAELLFSPGERVHILKQMQENLSKRKTAQPLEYPNAGSVFRNPPGDSAGRLIEAAGWKGKCVGGAEVSGKHANFILNRNQAMADDVLTLIEMIRQDVLNKYGVELVPEIEYLAPRR
ncbi:UDP-N-acetylmuramate dehydrogenase [Paradesulfitobacterium aromaticivorans]